MCRCPNIYVPDYKIERGYKESWILNQTFLATPHPSKTVIVW